MTKQERLEAVERLEELLAIAEAKLFYGIDIKEEDAANAQ